MGDKMRQLAQEIEKDEELRMAVMSTLLGGGLYVPMELLRNLDDPDKNEEVRALLQNVIRRNTAPADDENVDANYDYKHVRDKFIQACQKVGIEL